VKSDMKDDVMTSTGQGPPRYYRESVAEKDLRLYYVFITAIRRGRCYQDGPTSLSCWPVSQIAFLASNGHLIA
jgi:hypothetical protein